MPVELTASSARVGPVKHAGPLATLLLLVASLLPALCWAAEPSHPPVPSLRLPAGVRPTHYALDLSIDPSQPTFTGSVAIDLAIDSTTSFIWLHGTDLQVKSASITAGGKKIDAQPVQGDDDFLGFSFSRPVAAGTATLRIDYAATLDSVRSRGVYR